MTKGFLISLNLQSLGAHPLFLERKISSDTEDFHLLPVGFYNHSLTYKTMHSGEVNGAKWRIQFKITTLRAVQNLQVSKAGAHATGA